MHLFGKVNSDNFISPMYNLAEIILDKSPLEDKGTVSHPITVNFPTSTLSKLIPVVLRMPNLSYWYTNLGAELNACCCVNVIMPIPINKNKNIPIIIQIVFDFCL